MDRLKRIKLFLLDMDGTIYLDNSLFDGTTDFLNYVKSIGGRYIFLTNNSSKSVDKYIEKLDVPEQAQEFDRAEWESKICSVYGTAAQGVIELQNKAGVYNEDKISIYKEKWNEIRKILEDAPSVDEITSYLESVGLDISKFEKMYDAKKLENAKCYAKDLKDRYSVLWLYYCLFYRSDV